MKRSAALTPLSHDHQHALAVALELRRGSDRASARRAFLEFVEAEGEEHFRLEEEVVLPFVADVLPATDPDVVRMLEEHAALRARAASLAADPDAQITELRATGELLLNHVRFEERVLFPRVEALLDSDRLSELGGRLLAHHRTHPPSDSP